MSFLRIEAEGDGLPGEAAAARNMLRFAVPTLAIGGVVAQTGPKGRVLAAVLLLFPGVLMLAKAFFHGVAVVAARMTGPRKALLQVAVAAGSVALLLWFFGHRASPLWQVLPYAITSAWDAGALAVCVYVAFHGAREMGADPSVRAYLVAVAAVFFLASVTASGGFGSGGDG